MNRSHMAVWARVAGAAVVAATACLPAWSQEVGQSDSEGYTLDFNDNQMPPGWSLEVDWGGDNHCGVADQHFHAGPAINSCRLTAPLTPVQGAKNLTFKWRGNVFQGVVATFQAVRVVNTDGQGFVAKIETKTNWGPGVRIYLENWPQVGEFVHQDLPDGEYEFTAQFIDDKLVLSGKRDGQVAFKHSVVGGALRLAEAARVDLWTYQYGAVNTDQWMDDVSIRQFKCRHPKHGTCK